MAAATHIPQELLKQLAVGGRMVLPLGSGEQRLTVVQRGPQGYTESTLEPVKFVPLLLGVA
jgi:protein-L-isoaspartate(D-aspartate) O-methyltransferase